MISTIRVRSEVHQKLLVILFCDRKIKIDGVRSSEPDTHTNCITNTDVLNHTHKSNSYLASSVANFQVCDPEIRGMAEAA